MTLSRRAKYSIGVWIIRGIGAALVIPLLWVIVFVLYLAGWFGLGLITVFALLVIGLELQDRNHGWENETVTQGGHDAET